MKHPKNSQTIDQRIVSRAVANNDIRDGLARYLKISEAHGIWTKADSEHVMWEVDRIIQQATMRLEKTRAMEIPSFHPPAHSTASPQPAERQPHDETHN